jgi:hypothetical protein
MSTPPAAGKKLPSLPIGRVLPRAHQGNDSRALSNAPVNNYAETIEKTDDTFTGQPTLILFRVVKPEFGNFLENRFFRSDFLNLAMASDRR